MPIVDSLVRPMRLTTMTDLREWIAADLRRHEIPPGVRGLAALVRLPSARWQIRLRVTEYLVNRAGPVLGGVARWRLQAASVKLGYSITANTIGPGLKLPHWGTIVISGKARVGPGATIHPGTCLGEHYGQAPTLGDNVSLGPGAKAYGPIEIGDGATLGANCVATSDVPPGVTVVGAPARPLPARTRPVDRSLG